MNPLAAMFRSTLHILEDAGDIKMFPPQRGSVSAKPARPWRVHVRRMHRRGCWSLQPASHLRPMQGRQLIWIALFPSEIFDRDSTLRVWA